MDAKIKRSLSGKTKAKLYEWGFITVMLAVPLTNLVIFYFAVNINSVLMAFQENLGGKTVWSGYQFTRLFKELGMSDFIITEAIRNTLIFFLLGLLIINPLSLLLAYFLYKKIIGYRIFRFVFFLPSIISATVLTALYKQLIAPGGVVALVVEALGGSVPLLGYLATEGTALTAIVIYTLWTGFGVNIILFNGAMTRIPEEVMEYARLDGVGSGRELVADHHSADLADALYHHHLCFCRDLHGKRPDPTVYKGTIRNLYHIVLDIRSGAGRQ